MDSTDKRAPRKCTYRCIEKGYCNNIALRNVHSSFKGDIEYDVF